MPSEEEPTPPSEEEPTPPSEEKPTPPREENPTPPSEENPTPPSEEEPTPPSEAGGCRQSGNPVDDCWRCDNDWASRRQSLAACSIGFGRSAGGGKDGDIYVVTSNSDDNPANPAPGTLRYAVTRSEPLWIIFASSMLITLKNELVITSYKTIDGRGVTVRIAGGGGLRMERVSNIIVHSIFVYDIVATGPGTVMCSSTNVRKRNRCDGDAISIFAAKNIWIDHCYLANAADGLIDVIKGSTDVTITNNFFTRHNKVMLFGASPADTMDRSMYVTVAYNKFGPGLTQRMPRVRYGNCHVVNNDYSSGWGIYAIGGSEAPIILAQGNVFNAYKSKKQVTSRINDGGPTFGGPENWEWKSEGDSFENGAYFSGVSMKWSAQSYSQTSSCSARPASMVSEMVRDAGPLICRRGAHCS
ncbi:hypothetical protein M758_9G049900 [Ceratodon purpureus]|nr:hypothetical protein M758_9G049900 [Ceratodon purpureus]KAG0605334.1 hypothetical protein M758_9G049900 [Ceratodon purpureus]